MLCPLAVLTVDNSVVDLETVEALYENVRISLNIMKNGNVSLYIAVLFIFIFVFLQRATSDELDIIVKHYEKCKADEGKLLDKPEQ